MKSFPLDLHTQTLKILLYMGVFISGAATLVHVLDDQSHLVDKVIPPISLLVFSSLLSLLISKPRYEKHILITSILTIFIALCIPSWLFSFVAFKNSHITLIHNFPPITSALLLFFIISFVFLPIKTALKMNFIAWGFIALPVLSYLSLHPDELWTPRGKEIFMTYGPFSVVISLFMSYQKNLSIKFDNFKQEHARLETEVRSDSLTQLPNRRACENHLNQAISRSHRIGIILLDLDHFKKINDAHGHSVGDKVLIQVAKKIEECVRSTASAYRWGGDEFVVLMNNPHLSQLETISHSIQLSLNHIKIEGVNIITTSIGIALSEPSDTALTLFIRADKAMYSAKALDRNQIVSA